MRIATASALGIALALTIVLDVGAILLDGLGIYLSVASEERP